MSYLNVNRYVYLYSFNGHSCAKPNALQTKNAMFALTNNNERNILCLQVKQDWQFVAMVLDRLFLWIFAAASIVGTLGIIAKAPMLYDTRIPLSAGSYSFSTP